MFSSFTCSFEAEQTDAPRPRRIHSNPLRLTLIAAAPNEPKVHIRFDPMLFDAMGGRAERTEAPVPRPAPNEPKARIRFNPAAFDAMKARAERTEAAGRSRRVRQAVPGRNAPSSLLAGCVRHPRPQRTVPSQTT
jgi:hypothetical protein